MYWGGKSGLPSLWHLWTWMYKTRDYKTLLLAQPSETDLISHYFSSRGHWSHTGRAVHASSVSPEALLFLQSPGLKCHSIRKFAPVWDVPFLCSQDVALSWRWVYKPSSLSAVWWIGGDRSVCLCRRTRADSLLRWAQVTAPALVWQWTLDGAGIWSSGEHLPFSLEENWLWDS